MEIRAVKRATEILSCVGAAPNGRSLTEIASAVGLSKATTYRILQTLVSAEFIRAEPAAATYFLGSALLRLARLLNPDRGLRQVALPHMEAARASTKETVALVLPYGDNRVTVDVLLGLHELKAAPEVGSVKPIYAGAAGKALLAFYSPEEVDRIIERTRLKPVTSSTIRSAAVLKRELVRIRSLGYAKSFEEAVEGQGAVAAPIFRDGTVVAAVNVCGPTVRLNRELLQKMAAGATEAANKITKALGNKPDRPVQINVSHAA